MRSARYFCFNFSERVLLLGASLFLSLHVITVTEGYDKGPVGQGTTGRRNHVPGVLAGLDELAASIPSIINISARRARKTCREHNKYYN